MFVAPLFHRAHTVRDCLLGDGQQAQATIDAQSHTPKVLFYACIALYGLYLACMQPQWVLAGEMWAEMATNYFVNATAPSLMTQLFAIDAGYVPLPQRLIALIGHGLRLPAAAIPYVYTWSAIGITGALVGSFCLRPFRALVQSDWLRFCVAVSVLLVADFETRTFINFTYYVAFFVAIVSALAMANRSIQVPVWAWCIPLLMVSKPAVLSALPAMLLAALVSERRFSRVAVASLVLCLLQILVMVSGPSAGPGILVSHFGILDKIFAGAAYFVGFAGALFMGRGGSQLIGMPMLWGLALLALCVGVLWTKKTRSNALILVGLSLLLFNTFLNAFALADSWNLDMQRLDGVPLYRHIIVGYFGITLVVAGLVEAGVQTELVKRWSIQRWLAPAAFVLWFLFSGWLLVTGSLNRAPGVPAIFNSQWQLMSGALDEGGPVCVPVDPIGWVYQRHCSLLNSDVGWRHSYAFTPVASSEGVVSLPLSPPALPAKTQLMSLAILVRPEALQTFVVNAQAVLSMKDGSTRYLLGASQIPVSGGLLHFSGRGVVAFADINSIVLEFETPVEAGYIVDGLTTRPAVLWLGK